MRARHICSRVGCANASPCPIHARMGWDRPPPQDRGYTPEWRREARAMLERGDHCVHCQVNKAAELDHIIPLSRGGSSDPWQNGAPLCGPCHKVKSERERLHL